MAIIPVQRTQNGETVELRLLFPQSKRRKSVVTKLNLNCRHVNVDYMCRSAIHWQNFNFWRRKNNCIKTTKVYFCTALVVIRINTADILFRGFYKLTESDMEPWSKRTYKEGNVLFNDALDTFYLRLYGVRHMVKDQSDSESRNPLQPHRLLFSIRGKGYFICIIPQTE